MRIQSALMLLAVPAMGAADQVITNYTGGSPEPIPVATTRNSGSIGEGISEIYEIVDVPGSDVYLARVRWASSGALASFTLDENQKPVPHGLFPNSGVSGAAGSSIFAENASGGFTFQAAQLVPFTIDASTHAVAYGSPVDFECPVSGAVLYPTPDGSRFAVHGAFRGECAVFAFDGAAVTLVAASTTPTGAADNCNQVFLNAAGTEAYGWSANTRRVWKYVVNEAAGTLDDGGAVVLPNTPNDPSRSCGFDPGRSLLFNRNDIPIQVVDLAAAPALSGTIPMNAFQYDATAFAFDPASSTGYYMHGGFAVGRFRTSGPMASWSGEQGYAGDPPDIADLTDSPAFAVSGDAQLLLAECTPWSSSAERLVATIVIGGNSTPESVRGVSLNTNNTLVNSESPVKMRAYTHTAGHPFRLGVYSGDTWQLIWQSPELASVNEGWVEVPVAQADWAQEHVTQFVAMAFLAPPGEPFMSFGPSSIFENSFSEIAAYGPLPETISPNIRAGATYGLQLHTITRPNLSGVIVDSPNSELNYIGPAGIFASIDSKRASVTRVDFDDNPEFASPASVSAANATSANFDPGFAFSVPDGPVTVYVRGYNEPNSIAGDTVALEKILDSAPPAWDREVGISPTIANANYPIALTLTWNPPAADSGAPTTRAEYRTGPGFTFPAGTIIRPDGPSGSATLQVVSDPGGPISIEMRYGDLAGNFTEWVPAPAVELNRPPEIAASVAPTAPRTLDAVVGSFTVTEPDGQAVASTASKWRRTGAADIAGNTLPASATSKGQTWEYVVTATDSLGATGEAVVPVTIQNTPPTFPIVRILPRVPTPDQDLAVDVTTYSEDADGDKIGYDFRWYESTNGGASWVLKSELNGSSQVSEVYIEPGELWRVQYIPYEIGSARDRVEGQPADDQVFIGANELPRLRLLSALRRAEGAGDFPLRIVYSASDADGPAPNVEVYWSEEGSGLLNKATGAASGSAGSYEASLPLPADADVTVFVRARDDRGAVSLFSSMRVDTSAADESGWMLR